MLTLYRPLLPMLRNRWHPAFDSDESVTRAGEREVWNPRVDVVRENGHFKLAFGSTPLALHRKMRLDYARRLMEKGADYLTAAYECGFESASGFRDAFSREYGVSPGKLSRGGRQRDQGGMQ